MVANFYFIHAKTRCNYDKVPNVLSRNLTLKCDKRAKSESVLCTTESIKNMQVRGDYVVVHENIVREK